MINGPEAPVGDQMMGGQFQHRDYKQFESEPVRQPNDLQGLMQSMPSLEFDAQSASNTTHIGSFAVTNTAHCAKDKVVRAKDQVDLGKFDGRNSNTEQLVMTTLHPFPVVG